MLMGNDRLIYIARNKFPGVPIHGKVLVRVRVRVRVSSPACPSTARCAALATYCLPLTHHSPLTYD